MRTRSIAGALALLALLPGAAFAQTSCERVLRLLGSLPPDPCLSRGDVIVDAPSSAAGHGARRFVP